MIHVASAAMNESPALQAALRGKPKRERSHSERLAGPAQPRRCPAAAEREAERRVARALAARTMRLRVAGHHAVTIRWQKQMYRGGEGESHSVTRTHKPSFL